MAVVALKKPITQTSMRDYCQFIEDLANHPSLTKIPIRVGIKIAKGYRADWGYCCYSMDELAEWLGVSKRSVVSALADLEKHGFLHTSRTHNRNRYVPLYNQEASKCQPKVSTPRVRLRSEDEGIESGGSQAHHSAVQDSTLLSIEKASASSEASASTYRTTEKPTARREAPPRRRADADIPVASSWTNFAEHVLAHWRTPPDWDRWGLDRSVQAFIRTMRRECPRWCGTELATVRLGRWLKGERYKTNLAYIYRGIEEFEE